MTAAGAARQGPPREARRATADEARQLTGFSIGGIPPFGHRQPVRTVMDPDLGRFPTIWAAAGSSNAVFEMPPASLRMLANAVVAPVSDAAADASPPADAVTEVAGLRQSIG